MGLHLCFRVESKVCFPASFPVFHFWVLKSKKGLKRACRTLGLMCWQQLCIPAEAGRGRVEAEGRWRQGLEDVKDVNMMSAAMEDPSLISSC